MGNYMGCREALSIDVFIKIYKNTVACQWIVHVKARNLATTQFPAENMDAYVPKVRIDVSPDTISRMV
ncbi:hypothetical protein D3C84_935230 [compost metagenome]